MGGRIRKRRPRKRHRRSGPSVIVQPTVNNERETPAKPERNNTENSCVVPVKSKRGRMQVIINSVLIFAGILVVLITVLLYYHQQTAACWVTFAAITLFTLGG